MKKTLEFHQLAEQVQPQTGQILAVVDTIELKDCPATIARRYPNAARQAVGDQSLHLDAAGYLYLAH